MLPRSGRVGTIHTSAAEARDRSRAAYGTFYATIALPVMVYNNLAGKGLMAYYVVQLYFMHGLAEMREGEIRV